MSHAIEITQFSKFYGDVQAVNHINLQIEPGEIFGFLGLNGAGKTTTIRALLGMIKPGTGTLSMLGQSIFPENLNLWQQVGYLVEKPVAYPDLTVRENLEVARRLHGLHSPTVVEKTLDRLGITPYANRKAGTLSTGNLQRLGLARAVLHKPVLLILDEPANGLDPAGIVEIREMLKTQAQNQGVTIFMSSHILSEVDQLATRIGIIHNGALIEDLDKESLGRFKKRQLVVKTRNYDLACSILVNAGYDPAMNEQDKTILLSETRAVESPEEVASLLVRNGAPPMHLAVEQQSLEDHFMQLTRTSI
ncbi:MAG: ABC transporter ATP-binding protein [Anaerolineales bacterium]|nr:ABC transporter ATP-binding protein [Anaerolineales bacterium]